ncbi:BTAD domain-containing putative transcriptional regulator [Micromonospora sp. NPDC051141]|uniref:BTAD domain-containing putative transcriptional regulator n=1 Tax=Micromonospora sp. NPDC051141 TaxID=3364284 RepID=UPI00378E799D
MVEVLKPPVSRLRLLGTLEVVVDGTPRPVGGLRRRALLAALALQPGDVVSSRRLLEIAWPGRTTATRVNTLQSHLTHLRREYALRGLILARDSGYVLELADEFTDLQLAERRIHDAMLADDPAKVVGELRDALAAWRGPSLSDLRDLTWFNDQAVRLDGIRRAATNALVEARLALGEHHQLVAELAHAIEQQPLDEELHRQFMTALYRSGRQSDALSVYQRLKRTLAADLDTGPQVATNELYTAILRHAPELDLTAAGTTASLSGKLAAAPDAGGEGRDELVDRDHETGLIDEAMRAAAASAGTVLLFEGPPGMGKTSLLEYAEGQARQRGFTVMSVGGWPGESDAAWAGVRHLLHGETRASRESGRSASAGSALAREALLGWDQARGERAVGEYALLDSLYWLVADVAEHAPVALVVDDLQWLDVPSVRFLAYLSARLEALPILLVMGLRKGDDHRVQPLLSAFTSVTHILAPLTAAGSARLLNALTGMPPDDPVTAQCRRLSSGNPLLLRQLAKRVNGAAASGQDPASALEAGLPVISMLVRTQLDYFPPAAAVAAQALSVVGDGASVDALAQVAQARPQEVVEGLSILRDSAYVTETAGGFGFAHPLICEAVYEGVGSGVRAGLHVRAAGVALRVGDVVGAGSQLLRVPAGWGGEVDVVGVLGEAARVCLVRGAVDSAVAFLRRLLEEDLGEGRGGVLTRLGMAEFLVDTGAAVGHLAAGLALETDPETRARTALALAGAQFFAGHAAQAVTVCREALADGSISTSARLGLESCMIDAAYPARDALGLAQMIEAQRHLSGDDSDGGLMRDAALSVWDACRNDRRSAQQRAERAVAGDVLIRHPLAESTLACAWQVLDVCDAPQALPSVDAAIAHARRSGSLRALAPAMCFRSALMLSRGHLAEAVSDGRAGWEAVTTSSIHVGLPYIGNYLALALLHSGDVTGARVVLAEVQNGCPADISTRLFGEALIALALAEDDIPEAYRLAGALRDECDNLAIENPILADWRSPMIITLGALGRRRAAEDVCAQFIDVARAWDTPRAVARSLRLSATVAPLRKRPELLSEAAELLGRTEARLDRAQTLSALGNALLHLGYTDDARERLQQGHRLAAGCGAIPLRDALAERLHEVGVRPRTGDVTGRRGLTPSEARVADLAVRGLTDKEIAQKLYLTTRTVELHLTSAFRKLGVTTRTELARVLTQERP